MIVDIAGIAGGLVILVAGAEALVRGSVRLAVGLGMTPLVAGLTVAAFGTSSPELVVSLRAAFDGSGGLAVGNVIGSNICNIALILGITATIRPLTVNTQVVRMDAPIMLGATILLIGLLWNGILGRIEGAVLLGLLVAYTVWSIQYARKQKIAADPSDPTPERPRVLDGVLILVGLLLLVVGGSLFVSSATDVARDIGISEAVIGLTMVAAGTSLPELATSIIAAIRGHADIAVGNVIGSNIFNILGILAVTALVTPIVATGIGLREFAVLGAASLVVLPLARTGFTLTRLEGILLLTGYSGYIIWLFLAGS